MSSTPQFTQQQLDAARSTHWRQAGEPLLTLDAARDWIAGFGLVLFSPRAQQLPAPAPSFVEATLGRAAAEPTLAETDTARSLLARLTAEAAVLPLNLLGGPATSNPTPDFLVSAAAFPYIFTLRGDKNWKQPPATSNSGTVSPLALKVFEALSAGNALSAADLTSELGRELTENAVLRSLHELWSQLRVLPLLQPDGGPALWELTTRRFTKQLKSGANAGQPTALSALISLYLAQSYAALEDQIEIFLSPLVARSRVRDVLHGLTAGRQLEPIVLEGKRLLYIPDALPEFAEPAASDASADESASGLDLAASDPGAIDGPQERIRRFDAPRSPRPATSARAPRLDRPDRAPRADRDRPSGARDRKPFDRKPAGDRPARPYQDRAARPAGDRPARSFGAKPRKPFGEKPARSFGDRPRKPFGDKPSRPSGDRPAKPFADRGPRPERTSGDRERRPFNREQPAFNRPWDEDRKPREPREGSDAPRRDFSDRPRTPRPDREGPARERSARPAGDRPFQSRSRREGPPGDRPFRERPARPTGDRPYKPRPRSGESSGKPSDRAPRRPSSDFAPRTERPFRPRREDGENARPPRTFRPREDQAGESSRPRPSGPRTSGPRPGGKPGFAGKPRPGGKPAYGRKPAFGARPGFAGKPRSGDKPSFGSQPRTGGKPAFGRKPAFGAKPGGKPRSSDKPGGSKPSFGSKPPRGVNPRKASRSSSPKPPRETEE